MTKINRLKPRPVLITFAEYQAIRCALGELEMTLGAGYLSNDEEKEYKKHIKQMEWLITKIIK